MNIFEIIFQDRDFDSLNQMVRWNGRRVIKKESVGEHTNMVVFFTRLLAEEIYDGNSQYYNKCLEATTLAIFHDFEELFTGDISHNVKYNCLNGGEIRNLLNNFVTREVVDKFNKGTKSESVMLDCFNKYSEESHLLVKIADWLSMSYFLRREKSLGNDNLNDIADYCRDKVRSSSLALKEHLINRGPTKVNISILNSLQSWNL